MRTDEAQARARAHSILLRETLAILRERIEDGSFAQKRLSKALLELGLEADRLHALGLPTGDLRALYDTLLWLSGHDAAEGQGV